MAREFKLPDLGEGVHEGQIVRLCAKEGDEIKEDQPLMEVETDKAAVEIPCPFTGVIEKWHVEEKQTVNVGDVMVTFGGGDAKKDSSAATKGERAKPRAAEAGSNSGGGSATMTKSTAGRRTAASPAVRKLAREKNIDLETIEGSGPGGRITRADVEAAAQGGGGAATASAAPAQTRQASRAMPRAASVPAAPPMTPSGELPDGKDETDQYGEIRRVEITQARKTIAKVMAQSWETIPHVTDSDDADVTELDRLRKQYNEQELAEDQPKLTLLAFLVRAVAKALRLYPTFNASFDTEKQEIIYRKYINIAVGVHTERGLIAPVIRDTDQLAVPQIAQKLAEISEKARTATFAVNDTRGGTYTISNPGAVGGSRYSTPIITPPQVAVIATGRSRWMPWVVDGEIVPRFIMPLSHSFDHRIIDGGDEVMFMRQVRGDLEYPGRLLL